MRGSLSRRPTAGGRLTLEAVNEADIEAALDEPRSIGYTYKCLGAGLWGLQSEASFATTLQTLVAAGGDADTNGAVCGALLGCRLGWSQLPQEWVAQLPHAGWLEAHVQKLTYMLGLRR